MSVTSGPCHKCISQAMSTEDIEKKILAVHDEERSLRSLAQELVCLRSTHRCQSEEELEALRQKIRFLTEENEVLQVVISTLEADDAQKREVLIRVESERDRLEREMEMTGDDGLKQDITCLERELALTERLTESEAMRHMQRQEDLFTLVNTLRPRWREVHGVALRCIFENLLPPQGLLQDSIANGPESRWCRMTRSMKSIVLVCKSWHAAAYPLLYRDIVLRRVGQIAAFARTLRSSPGTFSSYVRSVTITCGILDSWKRVTGQSLAYIVQQCLNLTSLSFRPVFVDHGPDAHIPLPVLHTGLTPLTIPDNITHVGLFDERQFSHDVKPPFSSLTLLLSWCAHLTSLSISASSLPLPSDMMVVQFPQLETLSIWSFRGNEDNVKNLPLSWDIPKLSALRLKPAVCCNQKSGARLASFCRKHGHTVTHLDFGGDRDFKFSLESLDQQTTAASLCPNLRHLVLRVSESESESQASLEQIWDHLKQSQLWSMEIELVDVTVESLAELEPELLEDLVRGSAWKRVRHLDIDLLTWIPELPYLFPVSDHAAEWPRTMDCYGLKFKEMEDRLVLNAESWGNASPGSTPTTREISYENGSDDGSSTSESEYQPSSSEFQDEDFLTDEYETDEEPGELTEEEALNIYLDTLDAE